MPLTDTAVRRAKPKEKPYKLLDKEGLPLPSLVHSNGGHFWGLKYRLHGGKIETAHRAMGRASQVFQHAVAHMTLSERAAASRERMGLAGSTYYKLRRL